MATMKTLAMVGCALALCTGAWAHVSGKEAFARLKKLEGTWESTTEGMTGKVTYRVTAAGSAVVETQLPGEPHEMVTVYFMDGNDLVLVHYCAAQNQPRMKYVPSDDAKTLTFAFDGGTNIDPKGMHMHDLKIEFKSDDEIVATWGAFMSGKPADKAAFALKRVKS